MKHQERRAFGAEAIQIERRDGAALPLIVGHPSVFNQETDIGGWFIERVAPGAFARTIGESDIRALFNHDANLVLGRNRAKTLRLSEDDAGLKMEITPPDTQMARDLIVSLERGDISGGSIGFRAMKQEWDESGDILIRTLLDIELYDVSPVTFPAFPQTDVGTRSLDLLEGIPEDVRRRIEAKRVQTRGLTTDRATPLIRRDLRQILQTRR